MSRKECGNVKTSKITVSILLILLMIAGWTCGLLGIMDGSEKEAGAMTNYKKCIELAEDYSRRGLYQKAIVQYENAVSARNEEADWEALMESYEKRYKESDDILEDYITAAKKAVDAYGNAGFYKKLTELCLEKDDYSTACRYLGRALNAGIEDESLKELYEEVRYACELDNRYYLSIQSMCNGNYPVSSQGQWGLLSQKNKLTVKCQYDFIGHVSEEGIYLFTNENMSGLMDMEELLQGKFTFTPEDAGIYSEGLIAVKDKNSWAYYDLLGDKQIGDYQAAGTFQDGKAAVNTGDGWVLINPDGEIVSDTYEEIRLNPDGTYLKNDIMLAKQDGSWHLYDEKEKRTGDFFCDEIDIVTDDNMIAFEKDGQWGFVNSEGTVVIEPAYEQAKSFSEGLAAVYVDNWWGFINEENRLVIDASYLNVDYFNEEGSCMVQTAGDTWQLLKRHVNE